MSTEHPITPPTELVRQWAVYKTGHESPVQLWYNVANQAARWGADQELEACCEWFRVKGYHPEVYRDLRAARRPPPSLKEQALQELERIVTLLMPVTGPNKVERFAIIRRALEQLDD